MRRQLVERREELGLSQEGLALKAGVGKRSIVRWENGGAIRAAQRQAYADGLEWPLSRLVLVLAGDDASAASNGHSVPNDLGLLVSLEQGASEIRRCESVVVPGLLQTEAYACVIESLGPTPPTSDEIARRVEQRLTRQKALKKRDPLRLFALLDASVFLRTTGGSDVMADQLDHVHAMNERPNVEVRVVPLDQRAHVVARGAFSLLTSSGAALPFAVITENVVDVQYIGNAGVVRAHMELWEHLWRGSDGLQEIELQRT